MPAVHVRVVDADTSQPLAVRLRVTDARGRSCVPFGRPAVFRLGPGEDVGGQVRLGDEDWYYVDGGAEMVIPPGPVRIVAWRGFEYRPLLHETEVKPGQLAIRLRMQRWTDERRSGWYSGDTSVFEISPHAALLEGAAEDLAVVNLLAREQELGDAVRISNLTAFSGSESALERPAHCVTVGTLNRHTQLGALGLLGCHRPVFPLRAGVPDGRLDWSLSDWCDQAHRKKDGLVVWSSGLEAHAGELLSAALLGKIDALEVTSGHHSSGMDWMRLLEVGTRLALIGGSRKESNTVPTGQMRTYARLAPGEEFSYRAWLDAVRAGRTYATSGPLLALTVAAVEPGGCVNLPSAGTVSVCASARSIVPFECLELVHDGRVIERIEPVGDPLHASVMTDLPIERTGWIALRCRNNVVCAETSAVWVSVGGQRIAPGVEPEWLRAALDRTRRWLDEDSVPHDEQLVRQLQTHLATAEARLRTT